MISRRSLLLSVSALALAKASSAQPGLRETSPVRQFAGNPYVVISAIDVSAGIVCSRTSGQTPCFVQVSASAIKAAGTSLPFEDLYFHWNFGDSNGSEIFVDPTNETKINANDGQFGPEAVYCYRNHGDYIVTLTIRGADGRGGYISASVRQKIAVTAFDATGGHVYFSSLRPGSTNSGSRANPYTLMTDGITDATDLVAKLAIPNVALHFERGSSWTLDTTTPGLGASFTKMSPFYFSASHVRVDANLPNGSPYGSGANPLFIIKGTGIALTGSISNGSGGAGTSLNITANSARRKMVIGAPVNGLGIGGAMITDNSSANSDGTGNYTVNKSLNVARAPMGTNLSVIGSVTDGSGGVGTILNVVDNSFGFKLPVNALIWDGNFGRVPSPTRITDNSRSNADGTGYYTVSRSLNTQITFTGSISNGSGGTGTTLNISTAISGGRLPIGSIISGPEFTTTTVVGNSSANSNGTGNYTIKDSLNIASRTLTLNSEPISIQVPTAITTDNGGSNSPFPKSDIVMSGIDFRRTGSAVSSFAVLNFGTNRSANAKDIYFDHCNFATSVSALSFTNDIIFQRSQAAGATMTVTNAGFWGGSLTSEPGDLSGGIGMLFITNSFIFSIGMTINGSGSHSIFDHHIYPDVQTHACFRWNNFGAGPNRNFCLNCNWDDTSGLRGGASQYWCITQNVMSGTARAYDAGNATNKVGLTQFSSFVVESNSIHDLTADGAVVFSCAVTNTLRNNVIYSNTGRFWAPDDTQLKRRLAAKIYGNKFYRSRGSANGGIIDYRASGWTAPQFIKGNIFYDSEAKSICMVAIEADQVTAGSSIDFNQYYAPNDTDAKFMYDGIGTARAFGPAGTAGTWQNGGLDLNSLVQNPNWADPANGIF